MIVPHATRHSCLETKLYTSPQPQFNLTTHINTNKKQKISLKNKLNKHHHQTQPNNSAGCADGGGGRIATLLTRLAVLSHVDNNDVILDCEDYRALLSLPDHQAAYTVGVIALSAKMAKADGVVTRDEVTAFQQVFKVAPGEMKNVSRIFNLAEEDAAGYDSLCRATRISVAREPQAARGCA